MKTIYLNMKTNQGTETVDQISRDEYPDGKEYRKEIKRLVNEYNLAGMKVYTSQRQIKQ